MSGSGDQILRRDLLNERALEQCGIASRKLRERFHHAQGRVVGDALALHFGDCGIGDLIDERSVFDGIRA